MLPLGVLVVFVTWIWLHKTAIFKMTFNICSSVELIPKLTWWGAVALPLQGAQQDKLAEKSPMNSYIQEKIASLIIHHHHHLAAKH